MNIKRFGLGDDFLLRLFLVVLMICGGAAAASANPNTGSMPVGRWMTANQQAVIQIAPCGEDLCGQIVGIVLAHPNDPMPLSWQGLPQCGMVILQTAPAQDPDDPQWHGTVRDPRSGTLYQAQIALDAQRHLQLHGYVGLPIFGMTQVWTPYSGRTLAGCKLAAATSTASNG